MNSALLHSPGPDFTAGALSFPEGPAGSPPVRKVKFRRAERHQGRKSKSKSRALFEGLKSYFEITFQAFFWVK